MDTLQEVNQVGRTIQPTRATRGSMQRQRRDKGFFVAFGYSRDAQLEIKRAAREQNLEIILVTVQEILDEEVHFRV